MALTAPTPTMVKVCQRQPVPGSLRPLLGMKVLSPAQARACL